MTWQWQKRKISTWQKIKHLLRYGHRISDFEYVYAVPFSKHDSCRCVLVPLKEFSSDE